MENNENKLSDAPNHLRLSIHLDNDGKKKKDGYYDINNFQDNRLSFDNMSLSSALQSISPQTIEEKKVISESTENSSSTFSSSSNTGKDKASNSKNWLKFIYESIPLGASFAWTNILEVYGDKIIVSHLVTFFVILTCFVFAHEFFVIKPDYAHTSKCGRTGSYIFRIQRRVIAAILSSISFILFVYHLGEPAKSLDIYDEKLSLSLFIIFTIFSTLVNSIFRFRMKKEKILKKQNDQAFLSSVATNLVIQK